MQQPLQNPQRIAPGAAEGSVSHWGAHQAQGFAQHRKGLPAEVVSRIVDEFALTDRSNVMDLGCGTGICSLSFAPFVNSVIGIDHSQAMLAYARAELSKGSLRNVSFIDADICNLHAIGFGEVDVATICRAFFSFDKVRVLAAMDGVISPHGGIAVIDEPNFFERYEPWQKVLRETMHHWNPTVREPHVEQISTLDALQSSRFSNVRRETITLHRQWTVEGILNVMESTAIAPSQTLGSNYESFCRDLTERLLQLHPDGIIPERARYVLHLAKRLE